MSTPPDAFEPHRQCLGEQKLATRERSSNSGRGSGSSSKSRSARTSKTAQELNELLHKYLREEQVFRIDHYLGKETVQNLMVMRFANSIFEPIWNYKYIDHVQITVSETLGVGTRGGYYDKSGALRDMVQNHIFQLMALVAMEPPAALDAVSIRDEKVKVFKSIRPIRPEQVDDFAVRGQYGAGEAQRAEDRRAIGRKRTSRPIRKTETFAALKLFIDNWRWSGTPFYLRTGKFLPREAERGRRALPLAAADAVPEAVRVAGLSERPDHPRAAGRGDQLAAQRQGARRRDEHQVGRARLPLQDDLQRRAARGVRAADLRRDDRRPDAVHPRRRGRGRVGGDRPDRAGLGRVQAAAAGIRPRHLGPARARWT